jgi:hypothetical protein
MATSFSELLHEWHDFYVLLGTASATLVGLMFIAASIGATVFNEQSRAALAAFITPTVVHFGAVLFACLVVTIPTHSWHSLGLVLGVGGVAGTIHSGRLLIALIVRHSFNVDLVDRLFYVLIPLVAYVIALAAAVLLFEQSAFGAELIAAALLILLLAGLRNAWDMMVWIMIKVPGGPPPPAATP